MPAINQEAVSYRFLYAIIDKNFYEPIDNYTPILDDYYHPIRKSLPDSWTIEKHGVWFSCRSPESFMPPQGWKIHISATIFNALIIIKTVLPILVESKVPFKFAADRFLLFTMNGKRWPRGRSGKFITIYPRDLNQMKELISRLDCALIGYKGPYILSDKRYKNNPVIYYRYGGFIRKEHVLPSGEKSLMIVAPDGSLVEDTRSPLFTPPEWVKDPFHIENKNDTENSNTLKEGRYRIDSVLTFSNSGGVYLAWDNHTNQEVVIKEARPYSHVLQNGYDAVALLKKEQRLLSLLEGEKIAPRVIDSFQDWEHYYLVEEFIKGIKLRGYAVRRNLTLNTRPTSEDVKEFCKYFQRTFSKIAEILDCLHRHNIVFSDFSHNNILITDGSEEPRLIDFEGAYEIGIDSPSQMFTPGFIPTEGNEGFKIEMPEDRFALGAIMMSSLSLSIAMTTLDRTAPDRFMTQIVSDFGLPNKMRDIIYGLMNLNRDDRTHASTVIEQLVHPWEERDIGEPNISIEAGELDNCRMVVDKVIQYTLSSATYERQDRLFPADPAVFIINPINISYGASGVAYAIHSITGEVPPKITEWILNRKNDIGNSAGLYTGSAGLSYLLYEIGLTNDALKVADRIGQDPLHYKSSDLFSGIAGWGIVMLKLFISTQDEKYLALAIKGAHHLLECKQVDDQNYFWSNLDNEVFYGLAHGASGIALFLLYLYSVTNNEVWLDAGKRALEFDLSKPITNPQSGLTWQIQQGSPTVVPYWRYGSAGIGQVLLRYNTIFNDNKYKNILEQIVIDTDRKYAVFPGHLFGLAGLGQYFLDLAQFGYWHNQSIECAKKIAAGIMLFKIERPEGIAFPGEELMRISCDYGTGSAGIALFLNRLATKTNAPLMFDELLQYR